LNLIFLKKKTNIIISHGCSRVYY